MCLVRPPSVKYNTRLKLAPISYASAGKTIVPKRLAPKRMIVAVNLLMT